MDHPTPAEIQDLLDGSLNEQRTLAVKKHIDACNQCRSMASELNSQAIQHTVPLDQSTSPDERSVDHEKTDLNGHTIGINEPPEPSTGQTTRFGDYEILWEVARGGMGIVYQARHAKLNRIVALKTILRGTLARKADVKRFYAEAEAAANLDHPNIVPVYEVGEQDGEHYFSMGFVKGPSLAEKIAKGVLPPREAASVVKVISEAVAFAHSRGIVHRDLKPANVLLAIDEQETDLGYGSTIKTEGKQQTAKKSGTAELLAYTPKVTDFGLAKRFDDDEGMTATGQVLGTPAYMPPEQAAGKMSEVTETADVYSLGAILYAALIGRPPFQAANAIDTMRQVIDQEPSPPRKINPSIPVDLETICLKCLVKEPALRYSSADALASDLQCFLEGRAISAKPVGYWGHFTRWCRRNPVIAGLTSAVFLTLIVGVCLTSYFAVQANRETEIAEQNLQTATLEKAAAEVAREKADQATAKAVAAQKQLQIAKDEAEREREKTEIARQTAVEEKRIADEERLRAEKAESETRDALMKTRIALAEAYYLQENPEAMQRELGGVSQELRDANWRYLNSRADSSTLTVPSSQSAGLRFAEAIPNSDGRFVISGSDGTFIMNGRTGKLESTLPDDPESIAHDLFPNAASPDGTFFAGINRRAYGVEIYDLATRKLIFELKLNDRPPVFFDAKNNFFAARNDGAEKYAAGTWELQTKRPGFRLYKIAPMTDLLIGSLDDRLVALETLDGPVVWSAPDVPVSSAIRADCSPNGEYVSLLKEGKWIRTYQAGKQGPKDRIPLYTHDAPESQFARIFYSTQGNSLISVGRVGDSAPVRIWNRHTGQRIHSLMGTPASVQEAAYDPQTGILAVPYGRGVKVWSLGLDSATHFYPGDFGSFAFHDDNAIWRKKSDEAGIALVALVNQEDVLFRPSVPCTKVALSHDGTVAMLKRAAGNFLLASQAKKSFKETPVGYWRVDQSIAVSPTGKYCAALEYKGRVSIFDVATGKGVYETTMGVQGKQGAGNFVNFISDTRVVACRPLGPLGVFELVSFSVTGKDRKKQRLEYNVFSMAVSPDGKLVALGCGDNHVRILNSETLELARPPLRVHDQQVTAVQFHPSLPVIVTGSTSRVVRLWNRNSGKQMGEFIGLKSTPTTFDFSASGNRLGALAGELYLWDVEAMFRSLEKHSP